MVPHTRKEHGMADPLIETWQIHNRINLYLLDAIDDEVLAAAINPKNRSVWSLFAHVHNVRLMWLQSAAPNLLEGVEKLDTKEVGDRASLRSALVQSGRAVEELLKQGIAQGGKIKGFK